MSSSRKAGPNILISAGESSGDLYASKLVAALRERLPEARFFGCAGERMRREGVRAVVSAEDLAVVGLVEVLGHIPRIYGEYRKLAAEARREKPDLAILTDSPDFHLRLARRLHRLGVPVVYLVAPQVWAWRTSRIRILRRFVNRLLCIFPFEEEYFRVRSCPATYIGHPLSRIVRPKLTREGFFKKHRLPADRPLVTLLPGSRVGEAMRHLPPLVDCANQLHRERATTFLLAVPGGRADTFREPIRRSSIQLIEGETWDAIAHADVAVAASGTVTVEAALLRTPMVTFYRVTGLSWFLGRFLVDVPFYTMVNLVAGRRIVPELMQNEATGSNLAREVHRLLEDRRARDRMKADLEEVAAALTGPGDPMDRAAGMVQELLVEGSNDVR